MMNILILIHNHMITGKKNSGMYTLHELKWLWNYKCDNK
jgi:hypothetical protein